MAPQQVDWVTQRNRKDKVDKVLVHDKDDNDDDKVVEMMKEGDWRRVLQEFQGDDCYREPLLVDILAQISNIYTYLQIFTHIYAYLRISAGVDPAQPPQPRVYPAGGDQPRPGGRGQRGLRLRHPRVAPADGNRSLLDRAGNEGPHEGSQSRRRPSPG